MNCNKLVFTPSTSTNITKKLAQIQKSNNDISIAAHFSQFLKPFIANNEFLKEEVFKIRHDVYCRELAFEKMKQNGLEQDEFDNRSILSLIQHIPSQDFASCIRLVTSNSANELLPLEQHCLHAITDKSLLPNNFNRCEIGEISRLAVRSNFRRRATDQYKGAESGVINERVYSETELRCFPFIAIGLYMTAAIMSVKSGIKHVYVMMEPRLARSVRFVGIHFKQIGAPINYHGLRAPYHITPEQFINDLSPEFTLLYKCIERNIEQQLSSSN